MWKGKSMKTRLVGIITTMIFVVLIVGCSTNMKESVTLNDRQIDILLSEDLPTEWNKLTPNQQKSIQAIEEMLEYLENKYDKEFIYAGYKLPDMLGYDEESLLVYADGDNPKTDCFTVERTEDGFIDNYSEVLAYDAYQCMLDEAVKEIANDYVMKIFADIGKVDESNNVVNASAVVIVDSDKVENEDELAQEIEERIYNVDGVDDISLYFVKNTSVSDLTRDNWEEIIKTENIVNNYFTVREDILK